MMRGSRLSKRVLVSIAAMAATLAALAGCADGGLLEPDLVLFRFDT
jgi:hypothetical protein